MVNKLLLSIVLLGGVIHSVVGPPVDVRKKPEEEPANPEKLEDLGIEYGRYLEQVVRILEEDKDFVKKLENVSQEEIKNGAIAHQLEFVNRRVRSKLDEAKRIELQRLREYARQFMEIDELGMDRRAIKVPAHVDYRNPHSFEIADLKKLMQTAGKDLEEVDRKRRDDFKQYEMEKEHQYREGLKKMNEEERKAEESRHKEQAEKHKDHPKVHHPGSKPQLEQVWEEQDHMPKEEFDPNLFFSMHDVNGDNYLDEREVEAILSLEIKKMYDTNNTEDDPVEMMEEYHRMREHVYNEVDKNKDHLISREEFLEYTKKQDFERDEGWKGLDENQIFTEEELAQYERDHYQMQGQMPQDMAQYQFAQHPGAQYQHAPQQQPPVGVPHYQAAAPPNEHQQGYAPSHQQPQYQGIQQPQYHAQPQYQGQGVQQPQYHAQPQHFQGNAAVPPQHHPQMGAPHQGQIPPAHQPPIPNQKPIAHQQQQVQAPASNQAGNAQEKVNQNKL